MPEGRPVEENRLFRPNVADSPWSAVVSMVTVVFRNCSMRDRQELIRSLPVSSRPLRETTRLLVEWANCRDRMRYFACVNAHVNAG